MPAKRILRTVSIAEREKYRGLRDKLDSEKNEILSEAKRPKAAHDQAASELREAFRALKAERLSQGLSLAEMSERCGIARSALSRLENDPESNPTIATLTRYAEALGKKLNFVIAEAK